MGLLTHSQYLNHSALDYYENLRIVFHSLSVSFYCITFYVYFNDNPLFVGNEILSLYFSTTVKRHLCVDAKRKVINQLFLLQHLNDTHF